MKDVEKVELMGKTRSTTLLNILDVVLIEVAVKKDAMTLWEKL